MQRPRTGRPKLASPSYDHRRTWEVDPVCGMRIDVALRVGSLSHAGAEYSFCSAACAKAFARAPERYARSSSPPGGRQRASFDNSG